MTEEKLCLWLQEDILNRQIPAPGGPRPHQRQLKGALCCCHAATEPTLFESTEEEGLAAIAAQLQVPLEAVPDVLADDQLDAADSVEIDNDGDVVVPGALLKSGTVDSYVAAVTAPQGPVLDWPPCPSCPKRPSATRPLRQPQKGSRCQQSSSICRPWC